VISAVQEHGITGGRAEAGEGELPPSFRELTAAPASTAPACLRRSRSATTRTDQHILSDLGVTAAEVQQAAKKYLAPSNRTTIDRRPAPGGSK
jgi:hypothetical protein